ncbi:hypothetical protein [Moritella viscosa]|uniref:Uncharacterized protein n=1 Tax=Moritella viscosa TaxID=80854 RepID=A0ABY1HJV1_9GAMM|nr:hypothetical protein [Moritella viscosa]SGZ03307.1 Putative uncharacterized protein [Moritella viscosa]
MWTDMNVSVEYEINSKGGLLKRKLEQCEAGEPRSGVKCTSCNWESWLSDDDSNVFVNVYENLSTAMETVELTFKRVKA